MNILLLFVVASRIYSSFATFSLTNFATVIAVCCTVSYLNSQTLVSLGLCTYSLDHKQLDCYEHSMIPQQICHWFKQDCISSAHALPGGVVTVFL